MIRAETLYTQDGRFIGIFKLNEKTFFILRSNHNKTAEATGFVAA
jgi:hypothetical protein